MSNAILNTIAKYQTKLQRQLENLDSLKAEQKILGDSPALANKIARNEETVKETRAAIAKLNKHAGTLKDK